MQVAGEVIPIHKQYWKKKIEKMNTNISMYLYVTLSSKLLHLQST